MGWGNAGWYSRPSRAAVEAEGYGALVNSPPASVPSASSGPVFIRMFRRVGFTWDPQNQEKHSQEMLMAVALLASVAAVLVWAPAYILFNEWLSATIPVGYAVFTLGSLWLQRSFNSYRVWRTFQFTLTIALPSLLMLSLGGFVQGSAVILWAVLTPMGALVFGSRREAVSWFAAFGGVLILAGLLDPVVRSPNNIPEAVQIFFFVANLGVVSAIGIWLLWHYVEQQRRTLGLLEAEQEKSEMLLLNVLPEGTVGQLKDGVEIIADYYPSVSVLFADVVGFTVMSSGASPEKMVGVLNKIFSRFDELAAEYGVEKIRTIGDGYMAICGAPVERADHAERLAQMALDMAASEMPEVDGQRCELRIGINSGDVVAGVVGNTKFHYDVWGDAVNVAARMESQGVPGRIQVGPGAYALIKDHFVCEPRGAQEIKGKGLMETWFLERRSANTTSTVTVSAEPR
jgi:adenylate cyclase